MLFCAWASRSITLFLWGLPCVPGPFPSSPGPETGLYGSLSGPRGNLRRYRGPGSPRHTGVASCASNSSAKSTSLRARDEAGDWCEMWRVSVSGLVSCIIQPGTGASSTEAARLRPKSKEETLRHMKSFPGRKRQTAPGRTRCERFSQAFGESGSAPCSLEGPAASEARGNHESISS